MPEYPDVELYVECLSKLLVGQRLTASTMTSPFVLRTADPPVDCLEGKRLEGVHRQGKRIVLEFSESVFVSIHLMISGRLRHTRKPPGPKRSRSLLAVWIFEDGQILWLSEVAKKKRAAIHIVVGSRALAQLDRGGLEVFELTPSAFIAQLRAHRHTLKRALSDPRIFSGIGNAYSDEILHHAQLSPFARTRVLSEPDCIKLLDSCKTVLGTWKTRLRDQMRGAFPTKVTAFHPEMAVHGKYGQPCPRCSAPVQRIVHGEREMNYCPPCQTKGKLLADRALSRLLRSDWPTSIEALEDHLARRRDT